MNVESIQMGLTVIGGVALGLPLLLRAIRGILLVIPGDQGEATIEALEKKLEALARVITGLNLKRDVLKQEEAPKA